VPLEGKKTRNYSKHSGADDSNYVVQIAKYLIKATLKLRLLWGFRIVNINEHDTKK
jgi:hypothetical protein